ncbi:hypothetical protein NQ315_013999 [Exocentrus adspersus]|uniref:Uncharacterized protein n=1 Tax=Exocentrus adspersus TaxID=1586481 RepID=A0AAV8VH01_9CUCU|nr:hypothetical protein NQ315_013999 [Exocentrus adspersus]
MIDMGTDLSRWYQTNIFETLRDKVTLHHIESLEININKYEFTNGGTSYIELPKEIQLKHAVVNIRNNDHFCFAYSIMSCLYPTQRNAERISSYPNFREVLNFTGINFPVTIEQISKFENLNSISVNVYTLKLNGGEYSVVPAYVTRKKLDRHANLLLIQNKYFPDDEYNAKNYKNFEITYHYTWIRNLSRLLSKQVSQHVFYDRCLNYFSTQMLLEKHEIDCANINSCKVSFPTDKYLYFKNYKYKEAVPFII